MFGDVYISTYPKTGTTWLQQICHQLRTGGDTDFEEISEEGIVPWLEMGPSLQIDVALPQRASPRCFKSHQLLSSLSHLESDGAKFLGIVRDPEKTLVSNFKFSMEWGDPAAESRDINLYIKSAVIVGPGGWGEDGPEFGGTLWDQYAEFWKCRHLPNVKILVYEHMVEDLSSLLGSLNDFLGLPPLDANRKATVLAYSRIDWMKRNEHLFDDHYIAERLRRIAGESSQVQDCPSKVALGAPKDANVTLTDESRQLLAHMWREKMLPVTGHSSYADMIQDLRCTLGAC